MKTVATIALLLLGITAWRIIFNGFPPALITFGPLGPWWLLVFLLIVIAVSITPPVAGSIDRLLTRFSKPSPRARGIGSIVAGIFTTLYLYGTAASQHRQFFPYVHDEFSYLIQAHQFAKHRLWMPAHPIAMFFDSFQLFTNPVYASAYFPGTAITHLPGVWLHLPPYVTSLIVSGIVAGSLFWITTEILTGPAGVLAVLLLLSDSLFRQLSIMTLAHVPVLMYGLLATIAWMQWQKNHRADWAIGIGFFLGLAAITRPVDSLCFAIPIAFAMLTECLIPPTPGWRLKLSPVVAEAPTPDKPKFTTPTILAIFTGFLPLLLLQLLLNHSITGDWFTTPFTTYADHQYPGSAYGFHPVNPFAEPQSNLPQLHAIFDRYRPLIQNHKPENIFKDLLTNRLQWVASQVSPTPFLLLILLMPLALLNLKRSIAAVVLSPLPLLVLFYVPYFLFLPSYALPTAPAVIVAILLGADTLAKSWPRHRRFFTVALTVFIAGLCIASLPNWWGQPPEDTFRADLLSNVNQQLATLPHRPAVVLFKYDPARNVDEEPVYNADVASPDDAPIIRAHDLGPMNTEIFRYYADTQPDRFFYRYDEKTKILQPLGTAQQLAVGQ